MKNRKFQGQWQNAVAVNCYCAPSPKLWSVGDNWRLLQFFLICSSLGGSLVIGLLGCGKVEREEKKGVVEATQVVEGFQLTETDFGIKTWVLKAQKALEFEDRIEVYGVEIVFCDSEGKQNSTLTSETGIVLQETRDMVATGNVVVQALDGTRLETDQLQWSDDRKKILTDSHVRIIKGESLITGKGMESNPDLSHMEIREDFEARKINEEGNKNE